MNSLINKFKIEKISYRDLIISIIILFLLAQGLLMIAANNDQNNSNHSSNRLIKLPSFKRASYTDFSRNINWPRLELAKSNLTPSMSSSLYYVLIDGSLGMNNSDCAEGRTKKDVLISALIDFANKLPKESELGLLISDKQGISERLSLGLNNKDKFTEEVKKLDPEGPTKLKSAISNAAIKIEKAAAEHLGYGEYNLVILTDGKVSSEEKPKQVLKNIISNTPIILHTIGLCIGDKHALNKPGLVYYKNAQNSEELNLGLQEVLAEPKNFNLELLKFTPIT